MKRKRDVTYWLFVISIALLSYTVYTLQKDINVLVKNQETIRAEQLQIYENQKHIGSCVTSNQDAIITGYRYFLIRGSQ